MSSTSSPFGKLWLKWKAFRLPWRKRWLAGWDLAGNSYWYFRPTRSSPARRILKSDPRIRHSDIHIPPQWHQWLRYTRSSPPSLAEQQLDTVRQIELKRLARAADERWASKPSVLDKPRVDEGQLAEEGLATAEEVRMDGDRDRKRRGPEELNGKQEKGPWKEQQGNPGERWQPQTWSPGISNSNNNL